jgi:hypothetical protein
MNGYIGFHYQAVLEDEEHTVGDMTVMFSVL